MAEQKLIDELQNLIENNALKIQCNDDLQNIEFLNNFDIEELQIASCKNIIPKLNNPRIKKISFNYCQIDSLAELELPNLESLQIKDYNVRDIFLLGVGEYTKLKELTLNGYDLDLELIPKFQFTKLELSECNLKNVEVLTQFTQLIDLNLSSNTNIDITPLAQIVHLNILDLSGCNLNNVDVLKSLIFLNDLDLSSNDIIDISPLQFLGQLKELSLSLNPLINICLLQHMKQLTVLCLAGCSLVDITYLKPLANLKELYIGYNNIVYLEPLQDLKQIVYLNAERNKIINVSVLKDHLQFSSYRKNGQKEPNAAEIEVANKLRDVNAQITSLRRMSTMHSCLKSKMALQRKQAYDCLQRISQNYSLFIEYVVLLFQQQSSNRDIQ
ncbi:leucine-rich_repeat domain-containing protein [Hexamita inflata]|uniref:Leucine-rich repeat domain-containing protein n=1 Tax=Hexamita inflata TaxID=28002 RepID=A0AA86QRF7_9EUKA|nr:leucine-rich repeat domain-containing protein [Hexamita inflata]